MDGSGQSRKPPRPMPNATTARTKVLCVVATVAGTLFFVNNGATFATLMGAGATVLVFKHSELATNYKNLSRALTGLFVAAPLVSFMASMA
eukprot:COSAG06_NODE_55970_length_287_cov_0.632979_1_plen_90_part_10